MTDIEKTESQEATEAVANNPAKPGIIQSFLNAYINYFKFSGRASRYEYFSFLFIFMSTSLALLGATILISPLFIVLYLIFVLASIIPWLSSTSRRLHDTGRNLWNGFFNWYVYTLIISMVATAVTPSKNYDGFVIIYIITILLFLLAQIRYLVFVCKRGGSESNKYGQAPELNDKKHEETAIWLIIAFFALLLIIDVVVNLLSPQHNRYIMQSSSYSQSYNY